MVCSERPWAVPMVTVMSLFLVACAPLKSVRVASVALTLEDVGKAASKQRDPALIREGTPAYLMMLEGLLEAYPENRQLHLAACRAYSNYASMLPDTRESQARTEALYFRAKTHGFRALSPNADPGRFQNAAGGDLESFRNLLQSYGKKDVDTLFWATAAWAGWIGSSSGRPEAVADLPALEASIARLLELAPSYYYGGPHLLMGAYLAVKPPVTERNLAQSKDHFEQAIRLGGEHDLTARVMYAEYYARGIRDRGLFESTLREVLDAPESNVPELTLINSMAKEKARTLLERTEEFFNGPS